MKDKKQNINKTLICLLAISAVVRIVLANWIELGNDEAYYWTYALFPDWSHYDHPGMVGWVIQLFSLNLRFDSEFFLRLGSVFLMTVDTWLVYRIGKELKDERTGLLAALLYTASVYAFVLTGVFILPDTPLNLFWLLAFWSLLKYVRKTSSKHLLWAGLFIGLSILSKYTGIFLWLGFLLYILFYDRKTFKQPALYLAVLITAVCCLPILLWNLQNDWISFRFQGSRAQLIGPLTPMHFLKELGGEFLYNNPVNVVIAVLALGAVSRHKLPLAPPVQRLLLLTALPMIGLFWLVSLTQATLPHWSGPAYNLLLLLSALWLGTRTPKTQKTAVVLSLVTLAVILIGELPKLRLAWSPWTITRKPPCAARTTSASTSMAGDKQEKNSKPSARSKSPKA